MTLTLTETATVCWRCYIALDEHNRYPYELDMCEDCATAIYEPPQDFKESPVVAVSEYE